ncbi:hypothetical protein REPUB_Repub08aG0083700 [Reevesia pubescens]
MAKLGWHILTKTDSLWVEVVTRKYLKEVDFLSVAPKSYNSYTWKSILKGRDILLKGIGINVNNGKSTKFWIDDWLPCGPLITKGLRKISEEEAELHVVDYFEAGRGWQLDKLTEVLDAHYVDLVRTKWIASDCDVDDAFYWKLSSNGDFTVQYAYQVQILAPSLVEKGWNKIWTLMSPGKIKILLWKLLHGVLPVYAYLREKHIMSNSVCFRCALAIETVVHALRDCSKSKEVWLGINQDLENSDFFILPLKDWILSNLGYKYSNSGIPWSLLFSTALWFLWFWRNKLRHDESFIWPSNAVQQIWSYAKQSVDVLSSSLNTLRYMHMIKWTKPDPCVVKLNVDIGLRGQSGAAVAGGLIRDDRGVWLLGFIYRIGICEVLSAELWAIFQGLKFAWDNGFRNVELETDSLLASKQIHASIRKQNSNGRLIAEIQELLSRAWHCQVVHIYREANQCADWLATFSNNPPSDLLVLEDPPEGLYPLLLADSLGVLKPRLM